MTGSDVITVPFHSY